jgi:UDP-N-acetylmuramyl pentapeptide phosphotransferase/UDP-N-acetylglucosamine-1-phosphate transferase
MNRESPVVLGLGLLAAVLAGFVVLWIFLKIWFAFGFLAVALLLLAFGWWYDRREKRARAGLSQ